MQYNDRWSNFQGGQFPGGGAPQFPQQGGNRGYSSPMQPGFVPRGNNRWQDYGTTAPTVGGASLNWGELLPIVPDVEKELFDRKDKAHVSGINFDKYEDIPVEVTGNMPPQPISSFQASLHCVMRFVLATSFFLTGSVFSTHRRVSSFIRSF